jgi:hypothetical protein
MRHEACVLGTRHVFGHVSGHVRGMRHVVCGMRHAFGHAACAACGMRHATCVLVRMVCRGALRMLGCGGVLRMLCVVPMSLRTLRNVAHLFACCGCFLKV